MNSFDTDEQRQLDAVALKRVQDDLRADKEAHAIVCRLAADPNLDPLLANVLARQAGKAKSTRFDSGAVHSAFGLLGELE